MLWEVSEVYLKIKIDVAFRKKIKGSVDSPICEPSRSSTFTPRVELESIPFLASSTAVGAITVEATRAFNNKP